MQLSFLRENLGDYLTNGLLAPVVIEYFRELIYTYYKNHGRSFAWREAWDPYHIVVSEIMLQQTQTDRVKSKYEQFIIAFPTVQALAHASIAEVLKVWQGLGYNRRALALHAFAQRVMQDYHGTIPQDPEILQTFKGIGAATAASITAFAFNKPTVFIETNIRAVFIHCFFPQAEAVKDAELLPLVEQTLDRAQSRIWYYALMDYGVMLKKTHKNPSRKSAHYSVQSKFEGSQRQLRGAIIKQLTVTLHVTFKELTKSIERDPQEILSMLTSLEREGFIQKTKKGYSLAR
jgi:A/G-specific adenine glycosylase